MKRAFSVLEIKAYDDDERVIEGIASTPSADRMGDVVEPMGAKFALPMPLLWQHNHDEPVGHVEFAKPTAKGIPFKARIAKVDEPGKLKDRVDEAWQSVKAKLVSAVSIGFRSLQHEVMKDGGWRFKEWEWLELSLVTIPANSDATITAIKKFDAELRAASGQESEAEHAEEAAATAGKRVASVKATPGDTGTTTTKPNRQHGRTPMAKTIKEQIEAFEATRAAKSARMDELMQKAAEEGVTLDAEQTDEYDELEAEVKSIDAHLARLDRLEKANAAEAKEVKADGVKSASESRGGAVHATAKKELPKGTAFTRYAMALARSKGNLMQAAEVSKAWGDTPEVETVLRAAVAAGTTTDATWAAPLVEYNNMASEFIDLLRPQTIVGRINGLRRVPFNVKIPRQTSGSGAQWVGEGAPKPVSSLAFDNITLGFAKLAGIVVLTDELVRFSNPSAEALVRQDLISTIVETVDSDFVDPAKAASAGVSPASITNGVTPVAATGVTADAFRADFKSMADAFVAANMSLAGAVFIMQETQALALSLLLSPLGQPEFPGMSIAGGGTLMGLPVITSENVPDGVIILAKPSEILLADDGQVMLDASRVASVQMNDAPDNPATATTVMVSLWQNNLVGVRAERYINWAKRRSGAVQYISGANYGGTAA